MSSCRARAAACTYVARVFMPASIAQRDSTAAQSTPSIDSQGGEARAEWDLVGGAPMASLETGLLMGTQCVEMVAEAPACPTFHKVRTTLSMLQIIPMVVKVSNACAFHRWDITFPTQPQTSIVASRGRRRDQPAVLARTVVARGEVLGPFPDHNRELGKNEELPLSEDDSVAHRRQEHPKAARGAVTHKCLLRGMRRNRASGPASERARDAVTRGAHPTRMPAPTHPGLLSTRGQPPIHPNPPHVLGARHEGKHTQAAGPGEGGPERRQRRVARGRRKRSRQSVHHYVAGEVAHRRQHRSSADGVVAWYTTRPPRWRAAREHDLRWTSAQIRKMETARAWPFFADTWR